LISKGLSEVKRTADGSSYAFTALNLENGLQGDKIDDLAVALRNFLHIRTVNFSKNNLFMADEFVHLPYLQELNLAQNKVRDIRFLKENRESLCYLKSLNCDQNEVRELTDIPQMRLTHVNLNRNKITTCAEFNGGKALKVLELRNNRLVSLAGISHMPCLEELYVANNKITSLVGLEDLPSLKVLHIRGNQISEIPDEADLPNLPALKYINLRENKIDKDGPEIDKCSQIAKFAGFKALSKLNMQGNPYSDAADDGFKREVLIALDTLPWEFVNKDEVTEEDRTEAKQEKADRIKAAEEKAEEDRLAAAEAAANKQDEAENDD